MGHLKAHERIKSHFRQSHHQSNSEKTSDNLQKPVPLEGNNETN